MIVEHSVNIKRPVADVFAYLQDQRNALAWREGISIERLSPGDGLRGANRVSGHVWLNVLEQGFSKLLHELIAKSAGNVKSILEKATKGNRAQSGS